MIYDLIVVGGGAAGFYGAIQLASSRPGLNILILEKTSKLLSKVKVSGGGRCNVTHHIDNPFQLARHYPRGERSLKSLFKVYNARDVIDWFASKNVELKVEADGRMFPVSDNSMTIVNCFLEEASRLKIRIQTGESVSKVEIGANGFILSTQNESRFETRKILIATGGSANAGSYEWIHSLGHKINHPIPSLFTFNDGEKRFADLMGISVPEAEIKIQATRLMGRGPLLITHWGLSGPAIIKLSAWAASHLYDVSYKFDVSVNWVGVPVEGCRAQLLESKDVRSRQKITSNPMFALPQRLWQRLCELSDIQTDRIWGEASNKEINRLCEHLVHTVFHINGKTTFKEEFVTCGGVDLTEINLSTMESKLVPDVYFAGEVLHIDGETGGFNFQSAWTTGYVAAQGIAEPSQSTGVSNVSD
ncbi:MAG: NAD(P)/FAD-dependent oxidoreductase [Chryseolinea sp.]